MYGMNSILEDNNLENNYQCFRINGTNNNNNNNNNYKLREDSQVLQVLTPIISSSKICGSSPKLTSQFIQRFNPINLIALIVMHAYLLIVFIRWISIIAFNQNIFALFQQMAAIIRILVSVITFNFKFFKCIKVMKVLKEIDEYPTFNSDFRLQKLQKPVKYATIGCCLFILVYGILTAQVMFQETTGPYINMILYKHHSDSNLISSYVLMIIYWFVYIFLVVGNECFGIVFYISICLVLRYKVRDYNEFIRRLEERKLITSGNQIQEFECIDRYMLHSGLTSMVEGIEENYSLSVFLWVFSLICNVFVKIQTIVSGIKSSSYDDFGYIMIDLIYYATIFIMMSLIASEIGEENSAPVISVTKMAEGKITDLDFQQEAQLLLTKLSSSMMKLTGWKCFELNKSIMLTILGALATYTIIMVQMA